jgi:hypothetical protein
MNERKEEEWYRMGMMEGRRYGKKREQEKSIV